MAKPVSDSDFQIRQAALAIASGRLAEAIPPKVAVGDVADGVVERAKKYEAFLRGDA